MSSDIEDQEADEPHPMRRKRPPHHCLRFSKGTWVALISLMLTCSGGIITYIQNRSDAIQASDVVAGDRLAKIENRLSELDERMENIASQVKASDAGREEKTRILAKTEQRFDDLKEQMGRVIEKLDNLPTKTTSR